MIWQVLCLFLNSCKHLVSRIIYPPTSPSAHKVGKNVSWDVSCSVTFFPVENLWKNFFVQFFFVILKTFRWYFWVRSNQIKSWGFAFFLAQLVWIPDSDPMQSLFLFLSGRGEGKGRMPPKNYFLWLKFFSQKGWAESGSTQETYVHSLSFNSPRSV